MRTLVILALALALGLSATPALAWTGFVRPTPPGTFVTLPDPWSHWPPRRFEHRQFQSSPDVVIIAPGATLFLPPPVVWVPDQWAWNGFGWIWIPGHWTR